MNVQRQVCVGNPFLKQVDAFCIKLHRFTEQLFSQEEMSPFAFKHEVIPHIYYAACIIVPIFQG